MVKQILVWLALTSVLVGSVGLLAAPKKNKESREIRILRVRMERLFKRKRFSQAVELGKQLFQKTRQPRFLANIGLCYDLQHNDEQALIYYRQYLRLSPNAKNKNAVLERISLLRRRYSLKRREVTILSQPSGALVTIDGKKSLRTPVTRWLSFGRHVFRFSKPGFVSVKRTVDVRQGPAMTIDQSLARFGASGNLSLRTNVPAAVYINNNLIGRTPLENKLLNAGTYQLRVVAQGHRPWTRSVIIVGGKTTQLQVLLVKLDTRPVPRRKSKMSPLRISAWATLGGGTLMLITGLTLHLVARKKINDANSELDNTPFGQRTDEFIAEIQNRESKAKTMNRAGVAFLVLGTAALTASVVLWVFELTGKKERVRTGFQLLPEIRRDGIGFTGRFSF